MSDLDALTTLAAYRHIIATRCLTFIGFTILVYDHLLTFSEEFTQIWSRPKNAVSLMFLFNRYLTPMILMVDLYEKSGLSPPIARSFCSTWLLLEGYTVVLIFFFIHALVAIRVCALYEQKCWIIVLLRTSLLAYVTSMLTLVTIGLVPMSRHIRPVPQFNVCYAPVPMGLWVVWLPSLIFESIIFVLTIFRVVNYICRDISMPIANLMYRDGTIYFLAMGTISLLCLLDWLVAPPTLNGLSKYFGYALCVCASSKLVLNLRAFAPGNDLCIVSYDLPNFDTSVAPCLTSTSSSLGPRDLTGISPQLFDSAQQPHTPAVHGDACIETIQALPRAAFFRKTHGSQAFSPWLETIKPSLRVITSSSDLYRRPCIDTPGPSSAGSAESGILVPQLAIHTED